MSRRTVLIEEMFRDVATTREINKAESIYARGNKGAWTVFMIRIVKEHWDLMIAKKNYQESSDSLPDKVQEEKQTPVFNRLVKVNGEDVWW